MHKWLKENLVCPRDYSDLQLRGDCLVCLQGHSYPIVDGIPVLLLEESEPTGGAALATLRQIKEQGESSFADRDANIEGPIDSFVQAQIAATNGRLYIPLVGKLKRYPIPYLRMPDGDGLAFLDIGCNWGRWSIAAARKGYAVVGIDPSMDAIKAARRVSRQCDVTASFIVGDARHLPFRDETFDTVFSYSVLQHLSKGNVRRSLISIARVLKPGGTCLVQMPNKFGVVSMYHQLRRGFKSPSEFMVRYWAPRELVREFYSYFGSVALSVDGYFGLGIQMADAEMLPRRYKLVVYLSELIGSISQRFPVLVRFADSLYVKSANTSPAA